MQNRFTPCSKGNIITLSLLILLIISCTVPLKKEEGLRIQNNPG